MRGKKITIYLADGAPTGVLTAEIGNWNGLVIVVPRAQLADLANRKQAEQTGVYLLVGPDPDDPGRDRVYVGEGDNVYSRLKQHDTRVSLSVSGRNKSYIKQSFHWEKAPSDRIP